MKIWQAFPLLAIPVAIYNLIAFGGNLFGAVDVSACSERMGHAVHPLSCQLATPLFYLPMASTVQVQVGDTLQRVYWGMTAGDLLLVFSLVLLFGEVLKSTNARSSSVINHALSLVIFVVGLIEFLLFSPFSTSVFFLILMMTLLDVMAGFMVTIATTRRDFVRS